MSRAISERTKRIGEIYQARMAAGDPQARIIADLAAQHDVLRPAIWKSLRTCGVVPPYAPRTQGGQGRPLGGGQPGYTSQRNLNARSAHERREDALTNSRQATLEPCGRCGARADLGCTHQTAAGPKPLPLDFVKVRP